MYENEVNYKMERGNSIPKEIVSQFAATAKSLSHRTILHWEEHCTECMYPHCYTTCSLFSARSDGNCRLFIGGIVHVPMVKSTYSYLMKIHFKKWGKLYSAGNLYLLNTHVASVLERVHLIFTNGLKKFPLPGTIRKSFVLKSITAKRMLIRMLRRYNTKPDFFIIECFNPNSLPVSINITLRHEMDVKVIPYQNLFNFKPGYNRELLPVSEIEKVFLLSSPFKIELIPNRINEQIPLVFGCIDFVKGTFEKSDKDTGKKIKCVVWDLDNTIWNGVLIEDGIDKLELKKGVLEIIRTLDKRGILNSIASKNNAADAIGALKKFGIEEFFLVPQISWEPKSQSINTIAAELNIGLDTFLFVDDQPFEREEVRGSHPNVRVMDALKMNEILTLPETTVPITEESSRRRVMYREQEGRKKAKDNYKGDYNNFLKTCEIHLIIEPLTDTNIQRVYELAQRTNQMNFSGNRYKMERLRGIVSDTRYDTYVLRCEDKFGEYGIVGFGLVLQKEMRLIDLMFSCRIQSKRIEHAFLNHLLSKYFGRKQQDFLVNFKKTDKNRFSGRVFSELGFTEDGIENGITILKYQYTATVEPESIIAITDNTEKM